MHESVDQLARENVHFLKQGVLLLERISDTDYTSIPCGLGFHRVGAHMRHCLEFYGCFLTGLEKGSVDYDSRRRDHRIEESRLSALRCCTETIQILSGRVWSEREVRVCAAAGDSQESHWVTSSVGRELHFLAGHTVHHYALIAFILKVEGIEPGPEFGFARATLRHLADR